MYKKIACILAVIAIVLFVVLQLVGCAATPTEKDVSSTESMFVVIEETLSWRVVYHKETRVMYAVSYGVHNIGTFELLVNADGTPMLYEE